MPLKLKASIRKADRLTITVYSPEVQRALQNAAKKLKVSPTDVASWLIHLVIRQEELRKEQSDLYELFADQ